MKEAGTLQRDVDDERAGGKGVTKWTGQIGTDPAQKRTSELKNLV